MFEDSQDGDLLILSNNPICYMTTYWFVYRYSSY